MGFVVALVVVEARLGSFMIRAFPPTDLSSVLQLWLDTNLEAHPFIAADYWLDHFASVKEMMLTATIYVAENDTEIQGFIGLMGSYIAGIFVCSKFQSMGIGTQLLQYVQAHRDELSLQVYQKNDGAIRFYLKEDFEIYGEHFDLATAQMEFVMKWHKRVFLS